MLRKQEMVKGSKRFEITRLHMVTGSRGREEVSESGQEAAVSAGDGTGRMGPEQAGSFSQTYLLHQPDPGLRVWRLHYSPGYLAMHNTQLTQGSY